MARSKNHLHAAAVCEADAARIEAKRPSHLGEEWSRLQLEANKLRAVARWHRDRAVIAKAEGV